MLKRDDPFTPKISRGKKIKDYASPIVKTPLRNMLSASSIDAAKGGASRPTQTQIADSKQQERRKRALLSRTKKNADILSPAPGISPRAAPLHSPMLAARHSPSAAQLRPSPSSALSAQKLASIEQMTKSFEEWMRIAADNKINSKNTWNFALIDYFSELTFLRDGDNSINFQKASCTLDGCVKIYSSRVDAVVSETGKLLSGLSGRQRNSDESGGPDNNAEEGEEEADQQILTAKSSVAKRRTNRSQGNTLEKNPENLSIKGRLEADGATIDPLFKKMCADFDEATGGSLLFSLTVDCDAKVVFDSSSASLGSQRDIQDDGDSVFNASLLAQKFGLMLANVSDKGLTASLDSHPLLSGANEKLGNVHERLAMSLEKLSVAELEQPTAMDIDHNPFGAPPDSSIANAIDERAIYDDEAFNNGDEQLDIQPDDGFTQDTQLNAAFREQFVEGFSGACNAAESFAFLEAPGKMKTTWAGVEHWKIRRVNATAIAGANRQQAGGHSERRPARKNIEIEFEATDVDLEQLLARGGSNLMATPALPGDALYKSTCLPDDLHISSLQFTRLFLKPSWRFSQVRTIVPTAAALGSNTCAPIEHFEFIEQPLAAHAASNAHFGSADGYGGGEDDALAAAGPQEDGHADAFGENVADHLQSSLQLDNGITPPVPTAAVSNYAKRAKRVDIHLLKECIWSTISTSGSQRTMLSTIASRLPQQYNKGDDLSVQFAFICLLHLANEHGLAIEEQSNGDLAVLRE